MNTNLAEARRKFESDRVSWAEAGVIAMDTAFAYIPDGSFDYTMAMDSQPGLITSPNAGIPFWLTGFVDPKAYKVLTSPNTAVEILGGDEAKKGDWTDTIAYFPSVESTGQVASYDDYSTNGVVGVNMEFEPRQSYLYQIVAQYGDLEIERAGKARMNYVGEVQFATAKVMSKYQNLTYHYGVAGLQNYGLLNDPGVASNGTLTPGNKTAGGTKWMNGNSQNATANEVYTDIQSMFTQLVAQTGGLVTQTDELVLAMAPQVSVALNATNTYNVNVLALLKTNFPNLKVVTSVLYGAQSAQNPQGIAGGNLVQLIATSVDGQETGFCAFSEKQRAMPIVRDLSSYKQKNFGGTWGAVIRMPTAISQMLGV